MTTARARTILGVAVLALSLAALPAWADFETAVSHFRSGNYLEAAAEFQILVNENPDYADGYHMLGACFLKAGKSQDAEKNFLKAIEINGDNFNYHYNLANAYLAQKKYDKVVKTLNNAEGLCPQNQKHALYQLRGHALASQKQWANAIEDLERAVAGKPDTLTQAQLGKAYFYVGENQAAVTSLRKAVQAGASAGTHQLLIEAMINVAAKTGGETAKKNKYAEAMAEAEKFLAANSGSVEARYLVGRTALGARQFDKAIGAFDDVLSRKPGHCNALANQGKAYTAKGDWNGARAALQKATQCDAGMGLAWEGLGFVFQKNASLAGKNYAAKQRNYEQAIAAYQKAVAIKGSSSLDKAIKDCQHNLQIAMENQGLDQAEAEQAAAIAAEDERLAEEERKRKEWAAKQEEGD